MQTILVPTDFSKCARNAMTYALELARRSRAQVLALHVVYPNEGIDNSVYNALWVDDYLQRRTQGLTRWVRRFQRDTAWQDLDIQRLCEVGFPAATIRETAAKRGVDLIVMGATGATGLQGALLGSTSANVLAGSQTPVLVVPTEARFTAPGRFVLATDFHVQLDERTRQTLQEILHAQHSELDIVHVLDRPDQKANQARETALRQKLNGIPHQFHYVHDRNVEQAVADYLEITGTTGLVGIAHQHSPWHQFFFKSTTQNLARRVGVPMLVLPETKN